MTKIGFAVAGFFIATLSQVSIADADIFTPRIIERPANPIEMLLSKGVKAIVSSNCKLTEASNDASASSAADNLKSAIQDLETSKPAFDELSKNPIVRAVKLNFPVTQDTANAIAALRSAGLNTPSTYQELILAIYQIVDGEISDLRKITIPQDEIGLDSASLKIFEIKTMSERLFRALVTLSVRAG